MNLSEVPSVCEGTSFLQTKGSIESGKVCASLSASSQDAPLMC